MCLMDFQVLVFTKDHVCLRYGCIFQQAVARGDIFEVGVLSMRHVLLSNIIRNNYSVYSHEEEEVDDYSRISAYQDKEPQRYCRIVPLKRALIMKTYFMNRCSRCGFFMIRFFFQFLCSDCTISFA